MADNSPSGVLRSIEEFTRQLGNQASKEVLDAALQDLSPDDIKLRYLYACQMMASFTTPEERKAWHFGLIKMMAKQDGVDL